MTTLERPNVSYGNKEVALKNEILRSTVGSELHGITIPNDNSDHDELGIYIEPQENIYGLGEELPHFISRTQPEGVRSGAGDIDLTMYSLRKYIGLAIKGNPTVLLPLFAPEEDLIFITDLGAELRGIKDSFLSLEAAERFLGYMHAQHERMVGSGKRNRVPSRPELVEKYGFDVKYASHSLRLAYQGYELASEAKISLPMQDEARQECLDVKRGYWNVEQVSKRVKELEAQTQALLVNGKSPLPKHPDKVKVSKWMISAQERHWYETRLLAQI